MKSSSFTFRIIALPLFTLLLSGALVGQQYARRNRLRQELTTAQAEYVRQAKEMAVVPASASSLFSESKEHTHSEAEEAGHHEEASSAEAKPVASAGHVPPKIDIRHTIREAKLTR